jgi:RHS repeat-associated protein
VCTLNDTCQAGVCTGDKLPVGTSCSDNDPCNGVELCNAAGQCAAGVALADGTLCGGDVCAPQRCASGHCSAAVPAPNGTSCDDGDPCKAGATCQSGACNASSTNGFPCSDGDACNGLETCLNGACQPGTPPFTPDNDPCTTQACNPATGVVTTTNCGAIDKTAAGDVSSANSGILGGSVDPNTAAVLLGLVTETDGTTPIPNVIISVFDAPSAGATATQLDGHFVVAVNGGGTVRVRYEKQGYLTVERTAEARWKDYTWLPDVVMTPLDARVTAVELDYPSVQSARGGLVQDGDGVRQATVLIPPSTAAVVVHQDGTTTPLSSGALNIRATEFTAGAHGREAMPGSLPPATAYTYAVELTADEALDAASIQFVNAGNPSQPQALPFYVEDFINFPVGTAVPMGYYDRQKGVWVPSTDGRVVQILSITNGSAVLATKVDGNGNPIHDPSDETVLGVTAGELVELSSLYAAGQKLWRVPITHFTPWDANWPYGPPSDSCKDADTSCQPDTPNDPDPKPDDSCKGSGSVIECQAQVLGESMPITGTPYSLHYASDRVPGRREAYRLTIPVVGTQVPQSLKRIELVVQVAGKQFKQTYTCPCAGLPPYVLDWDGKDVFDRQTQGAQPAMFELRYVYNAVYKAPVPTGTGSSFGAGPGGVVTSFDYAANRAQNEVLGVRTWRGSLGGWDERGAGLGGWSVNVHHVYDPTAQVLYRGDGSRSSKGALVTTLTSVVGGGGAYAPVDCLNPAPNGCSASTVNGGQPASIVTKPDGTIIFADPNTARIRQLDPQGRVSTVLQLANVGYLVRAADGTLYVGTPGSGQGYLIKKIDPSLNVTVIAGNGASCGSNEATTKPCDFEGKATDASLSYLWGLSLAPDGNLYVGQGLRVRRIAPDGNIYNFAGTGTCNSSYTEGADAKSVNIGLLHGVLAAPDGQVYISSDGCYGGASLIRAVSPSGKITTVVGGGTSTDDGHSAVPKGTDPGLRLNTTGPLALTPDGHLVFIDNKSIGAYSYGLLRVIDEQGLVRTIAGPSSCYYNFCGSGAPATASNLGRIDGLGFAPDGSLLVGSNLGRVLRINSPLPRYGFGSILIASSDGRELYRFDNAGRHLETYDTLTNGLKLQFGYQNGRLVSITDPATQSFVTTFDSTDTTHPTITSPFGDVTSLALDASGNLATLTRHGGTAASPVDEVYTLIASADGLLTSFRDPMGTINASVEPAHAFSYDTSGAEPTGRLTRDQDPGGGDQSLSVASTTSNGVTTFEITKTMVQDVGSYVTKYDVSKDKTGLETRTNYLPGATTPAVETIAKDGTRTKTLPDGTTVTMVPHADPRYGMLSPTYKTTTTLPSPALSQVVDVQRFFDAQGLFHETRSLNGNAFDTMMLADGRTLQSTSPVGRTRTTILDAHGRVSVQSQPGFGLVSYTYTTDYGQLATTTRQATGEQDRVSQNAYYVPGSGLGYAGNLASTTDPLGHATSFDLYDRVGRVLQETLAGGRPVSFVYDANGNRVEIDPPPAKPQYGSNQALQAQHRFQYDAMNQLDGYELHDQAALPNVFLETTSYGYTPDRQLKTRLRPEGDTLTYTNTLGRLDDIALPGAGSVHRTYDPASGRLQGISGPMGVSLAFSYNGNLVTDVTWSGLVSGMTLHQDYDNNFREVAGTAAGLSIYFNYDADGLLQCVGTTQTTNCAGGLSLARATGAALLATTTFPVGGQSLITEGYTPNGFGETLHYQATSGGQSVYAVDFTRDLLGRIATKSETLLNADATTSAASLTYTYDVAGRLTDVTAGDGTHVHYDYDLSGNRLRRSVEGPGGNSEELGTYQVGDQLQTYAGRTYHYTASGVLQSVVDTNNATTTYTYDALGNLRTVVLPDATRIDYVVDGQNRRVGKMRNSRLVTAWLYEDDLRIAAEVDLDGQGNVTGKKRFGYGSKESVPDLMVMQDGTRYRILSDHLGSPRTIIAENGAIVARIDYDEFGRVLRDTQPGMVPFGFAGGLYDPETGLVRFGARDYDAETGRWTAKDPVRFDGGDVNLYLYAGGDPVNSADRTGNSPRDNRDCLASIVKGCEQGCHAMLCNDLCILSCVAYAAYDELYVSPGTYGPECLISHEICLGQASRALTFCIEHLKLSWSECLSVSTTAYNKCRTTL